MKRPGFPTNVEANAQALRGDSKFLSIAPDTSELLRFLPAPRADGMVFYPVTNHYGLVNQDKKKVALACLAQHGTTETGKRCLLCAVNEYFASNGEELGLDEDTANRLRPTTRFYAQVLRAVRSNNKVVGWSKPMLVQFSQTAANDIQSIFQNQQQFGTPLATDPDKGQALIVTRTGTSFKTKYKAERSGDVVALDEIRPTWADEFMDDLYKQIGLNIVAPSTQLAYLRVTFPGLDIEKIVEEAGFGDLLTAEEAA